MLKWALCSELCSIAAQNIARHSVFVRYPVCFSLLSSVWCGHFVFAAAMCIPRLRYTVQKQSRVQKKRDFITCHPRLAARSDRASCSWVSVSVPRRETGLLFRFCAVLAQDSRVKYRIILTVSQEPVRFIYFLFNSSPVAIPYDAMHGGHRWIKCLFIMTSNCATPCL